MNFRKTRSLRLLPSVMLVSGGLLILNASGIVHDAYAQGAAPASDALSAPAATGNTDFAGGDTQIASASEVDVLTSLSKRRSELDQRQAQLDVQANMLAATEARVDTKINQLKALQTQIAALLTQRDDAQKAQITALVKTYTGMGKKAGPIFSGLPDDVAVPVAQAMKPDDLAVIMGAMSADAAQKLSVKLASKLALPDTTDALAPVAGAPPAPQALVAPTPGTAAASAAAPVQTASAAPAPASASTPAPAKAAPAPATPAAAATKPKSN